MYEKSVERWVEILGSGGLQVFYWVCGFVVMFLVLRAYVGIRVSNGLNKKDFDSFYDPERNRRLSSAEEGSRTLRVEVGLLKKKILLLEERENGLDERLFDKVVALGDQSMSSAPVSKCPLTEAQVEAIIRQIKPKKKMGRAKKQATTEELPRVKKKRGRPRKVKDESE